MTSVFWRFPRGKMDCDGNQRGRRLASQSPEIIKVSKVGKENALERVWTPGRRRGSTTDPSSRRELRGDEFGPKACVRVEHSDLEKDQNKMSERVKGLRREQTLRPTCRKKRVRILQTLLHQRSELDLSEKQPKVSLYISSTKSKDLVELTCCRQRQDSA